MARIEFTGLATLTQSETGSLLHRDVVDEITNQLDVVAGHDLGLNLAIKAQKK